MLSEDETGTSGGDSSNFSSIVTNDMPIVLQLRDIKAGKQTSKEILVWPILVLIGVALLFIAKRFQLDRNATTNGSYGRPASGRSSERTFGQHPANRIHVSRSAEVSTTGGAAIKRPQIGHFEDLSSSERKKMPLLDEDQYERYRKRLRELTAEETDRRLKVYRSEFRERITEDLRDWSKLNIRDLVVIEEAAKRSTKT